jgi:hypothetical protein
MKSQNPLNKRSGLVLEIEGQEAFPFELIVSFP